MIKTININLAGMVFNVNEDAYAKLNSYLSAIRINFSNKKGGDEIISDIESRIAELFNQYLEETKKQAIEMAEVERVIEIMGSPDDYLSEEEQEENRNKNYNYQTYSRKLFRDGESKIIGGVSSGIAAYLGVDVVWIRLIWVISVLVYGFGLLPYIILWIVMPEARTTAEKIQMRGEPVNIETIEKSIKKEFNDIKDSFSKMGDDAKKKDFKQGMSNAGKSVSSAFDNILDVAMQILSFFVKLFGIILVLIGVIFIPIIIFGSSVSLSFFNDAFGNGGLNNFIDLFIYAGYSITLVTAVLLTLTVLPFVLLIMLGITLLGKKIKFFVTSLVIMGVMWFAALTMASVIVTKSTMEFNVKISESDKKEVLTLAGDELTVELLSEKSRIGKSRHRRIMGDMPLYFEDSTLVLQDVNLRVEKSSTNNFEIRVMKYATGKNEEMANLRTKAISYDYTFANDTLKLSNILKSPIGMKFREQSVSVTIYVPVDKNVKLNEDLRFLDYTNMKISDEWEQKWFKKSIYGHIWRMEAEGLVCTDCDEQLDENSDFY